jgi:hypothetical protein
MSWFIGPGADLWHTAAKAVLLFVTAVVGFRFGERRTFAQLAPFDFVAVVSTGAIVGRTATAPDAAFSVGAVAQVVVLLTHRVVARLRRWTPVAALVDQPVRLLIADGAVRDDELRRTGLTRDDLYGILRTRGVQRGAPVAPGSGAVSARPFRGCPTRVGVPCGVLRAPGRPGTGAPRHCREPGPWSGPRPRRPRRASWPRSARPGYRRG